MGVVGRIGPGAIINAIFGGRAATVAALLLATVGLSACGSTSGPVAWYRDLSGASANDSKDKAPNEANLASGSKEPYPNLASVPSLPDNAITAADRKRMAQSLIADRQNAQYTDQQLRAGQNMEAGAPPPVVAATPAATPQLAAAIAPPSSHRSEPPPARPVAAPRGPVHQETLPTADSAPPQAAQSPSATPSQKKNEAKKKDQSKKRQVQRKRGAEAVPQESSLRTPSIDNLPQGEQAQAAPPPPVGSPAARHTHPEEVAAAAAPSAGDDEAVHQHGTTGAVAEIRFAPPPFRARILPAGQKRLAEVARMAQQRNARIRIVGYGGAASGSNKQQREFQSFNAALDNAKAVGIELAKLGVPADRIDIETSTEANVRDHADIFVEQ